jgi:predicted amidohydrolase
MQMEDNYQKAATFIRSAAKQEAQLAVLPEYHLLNWVPQDPGFKDACAHWETYLQKYQALAKECNICIVPGTILELINAGKKDETLLNVAYFIDNHGEIAGRYVKKNLWGPIERLHLTSSSEDEHPVFDTPLGKVGMLICWDLAFPEAFREMIAKGAKIIIIPTFWTLSDCSPAGLAVNPSAEALFLDSMLTARCFENTCGELASVQFSTSFLLTIPSGHLRQRRRSTRQRLCRTVSSVRPLRRRHHSARKRGGRSGGR